MLRRCLLFFGLAGIMLTGCKPDGANPPQSGPREVSIPAGEIASRLSEFSMKDLRAGDTSTGDLRGKVVLIDFWATWCQPCEKETLGYQELLEKCRRNRSKEG